MMNLWPGITVDEWLGHYDGRTPLRAEYEYVKYYPNGVPQNTPTPNPTSTPTPTPTKNVSINKGDVNGDGYVDSTDCTLYKRYLLRKIREFPVNDLRVADLNNDGYIDSTDLTLMKRYILRKIPGF